MTTKTLQIECDGCNRTTTIAESQWNSDDYKAFPKCSCDKHWGWMLVGSQSWYDYHDNDIHPMETLRSKVIKGYDEITKKGQH